MKYVIDRGDMLPGQRDFWNLPNYIKLLLGGYGSGKTHIGALRALYLSAVNPHIPGMYIAPSYKQAKRTIEITLRSMMDRAGITYAENKTDHQFLIWNWNGVIWIGSGDEPNSLKGPNLAWVGIDEPFIQQREVLDVALSRVRHPEAKHREIFLTGTPEELNWGADLAEDTQQDVGVVVASTRDNHHLPSNYVTSMEAAYSADMVKAYIDGQLVNFTAGRVYNAFDPAVHVQRRNDVGGAQLIIGMDFNVSKMCATIGRKLTDGIHWEREVVLRDSNTFQMAEALRDYRGAVIYPDPAGSARKTSATLSDHQILRGAGFRVVAPTSHSPVRDRVNATNGLLRNARGEVRMTVDPDCVELIKDWNRVTWHNGDIDKRDMERTHMSDAAGYAVDYLFGLARRRVTVSERYAA